MSRLIESYPTWFTEGGIFFDLASNTAILAAHSWLANASELDTEFYGNHSGMKETSPLLDTLIDINRTTVGVTNPYILTSAQRAKLATIAANKFGLKWTKLYTAINSSYNPIENYDMTEVETPQLSLKHKVSSDFKIDNKVSVKTDITRTVTTDNESRGYGFNSPEAVPTAEVESSSTENQSGNPANNYSESEQSQVGYTEDEQTGTRQLTRHGNIGVTTSQQMLESELKLREWNFFESVFRDIASLLTCNVYQIKI